MRVLFVHPQACHLKRIVQSLQNCSGHEQFLPIMECLIFSHSTAFLTHAFYLALSDSLKGRDVGGYTGDGVGGGKFAK